MRNCKLLESLPVYITSLCGPLSKCINETFLPQPCTVLPRTSRKAVFLLDPLVTSVVHVFMFVGLETIHWPAPAKTFSNACFGKCRLNIA